MRRWAFVIAILGLFVLVLVFGFNRIEVSSLDELLLLEINQRVFLTGNIVSERVIYSGTWLLVLDSGIEMVCSCTRSFFGQVDVEGVVSEYNGKKQVEVLKIAG